MAQAVLARLNDKHKHKQAARSDLIVSCTTFAPFPPVSCDEVNVFLQSKFFHFN